MTTSPAFQIPPDIANRALQHLGQKRIVAFTDQSKNASETNACYDKLREAELRRNVWRFSIREAILRPIQDLQANVGNTTFYPTMLLVPQAYSPTATYIAGSIIQFTDGTLYQAINNIAANNPPAIPGNGWVEYFGNMVVQPYDTTGKTAYFSGEIVYTPVGANPGVYISIGNSNQDVPTVVNAWDATLAYKTGDTVTFSATVYQSTEDLNLNNTPTGAAPWITVPGTQPDVRQGQRWVKLGSTLKAINLIYPIGAGPTSQTVNKNVYQLPYGFLRKAPIDPKQGNTSYLGRPSNPLVDDWNLEGNYITSVYTAPIYVRFVSNIADVSTMDAMFCEGLAARIAIEVCEPLTQSDAKLAACERLYVKFMTEARTVNGIETGPEEAPLDDYLAARL